MKSLRCYQVSDLRGPSEELSVVVQDRREFGILTSIFRFPEAIMGTTQAFLSG